MARTWDLNTEELRRTIVRAERVNARAEKRGFTGRITVTHEPVKSAGVLANGLMAESVLYRTTITGEPPRYDGWEFIAALDWDWNAPEPILITRCAPGFDGVIDRDALTPGACDHCGTDRMRTKTYLVRDDSGQTRQVGSTCVQDFIGHIVGFAFVSEEECVDCDDEPGYGYGDSPRWTPKTIVAASWAVIQLQGGYVPASGYGTPTKYAVLDALTSPVMAGDKRASEFARTAAESPKMADEIIGTLLSDRFAGDSEYVINMKNLLGAESVDKKALGILASAPQAYTRLVEREIKEAAKSSAATGFIGSAGDKVEIRATVRTIRYTESWTPRGPKVTTIYKLVTDTGHVVTWFASRSALGDDITGEELVIRATVKGQNTWQGTDETIITRAKMVAPVAA